MDRKKALDFLKQAEHMIVFSGAGISTGSGIPDFRSENGLYAQVDRRYALPYPEAIFELDYLRKHPEPFFDLARTLLGEGCQPTACHRRVAELENQGKVELIVTQNIDGLHQRAGSRKLLECHGTFETAHCLNCRKAFRLENYRSALEQGSIPHCDCGGIIKPDIVFFGEALPKAFYALAQNPPPVDLVLILGTSLRVEPAASMARSFAVQAPSILVTRDPTPYDGEMTLVFRENLDEFAGWFCVG